MYSIVTVLLLGSFIIFGVMGIYKTENGIVLGLPNYEKRDILVSQIDLDILMKADSLLSSENSWRKNHELSCQNTKELDLYCALEKASIQVMGKYVHRQPALQEVRFTIDDNYRTRWTKHRLIDFNTNKDTSFEEIKFVLSKSISTVKGKLIRYKKSNDRERIK